MEINDLAAERRAGTVGLRRILPGRAAGLAGQGRAR